MLSTGIAMLAGAVLACLLPREIDSLWLSYLPICIFFAYYKTGWRFIWILLCSFLWTGVHIHWQLDHRLSAELNNKRLMVRGEVINIPRVEKNKARFLFKPHSIEGYSGKLPRLIRLNWRDSPDNLRPAQRWKLEVKIKRPWGFQNPGGFDYQRWLFARGIDATGYVIRSEQNSRLNASLTSINTFRAKILEHIEKQCSQCEQRGLIEALSLGYRGNLALSQRDLLQQTGTAHLIAISGLHIGIIASVFYFLGSQMWRFFARNKLLNRREIALLFSWVGALVYSLLSGFDLPAQRALLMLSVILLSLFLRQRFNLLNSIVLAMMMVLIWSPLAVLSASFWLTFSALMIIVLGAFTLQGVKSRVYKLAIIQLYFSLLFIPLTILIFDQLQLASLLANLVAVPLVSFVIVPLNFLVLTLFWLPSSMLVFLYGLVDSLIVWLVHYLHWLQHIGLQAQSVPEMNPWQVLILFLMLIVVLLPAGIIKARKFLLVLPLLLLWEETGLQQNEFSMTVLDVGMGTSLVVHTRNHSLVYDFGPGNRDGYSLGKWVLEPYLQHRGIETIDRVVISHADQDHAGGLYAIEDRLAFEAIYTGTMDETRQRFKQLKQLQNCHLTPPWRWDGVDFEFISSGYDAGDSENNRSCVLKVSSPYQSVLIAGDIGKKQEQKLMAFRAEKLKADILVAPHHGSLTSSSKSFIHQVDAQQVIFTVGYLNRWKFPRQTVLKRYQSTGAEIYRTDQHGAILISCQEKSCEIEKFRQKQPRLWY